MQFGVIVPQGWRLDLRDVPAGYPQYETMRGYAQEAERRNYDSVWVFDHFHTIPEVRYEPTFEAWMTCAGLAEATRRVRIGQIVTCNIYRPPALLAKMSATLDVMSNGRLEFGLGAGWYEHETVAYGYEFEKPSVRIGKLDEAIQIIRGMWTHDEFQFRGRYYTIGVGKVHNFHGEEMELRGAVNYPKPLQKPHPPIWLAGGGEKLTLRTVAKYGDWSNYFGASLDLVQKKNAILDEHCAAVGREPSQVRRSVCLEAHMGSFERYADVMLATGRRKSFVESARDSALTGGRQEMIDRLGELKDKGRIDYVVIYFVEGVKGDSMQRFAEEILPALRGTPITR